LLQLALDAGLQVGTMGLNIFSPPLLEWDDYKYPIDEQLRWDAEFKEKLKKTNLYPIDYALKRQLNQELADKRASIASFNKAAMKMFEYQQYFLKKEKRPWQKVMTSFTYVKAALSL
jgi:hypothetical protein